MTTSRRTIAARALAVTGLLLLAACSSSSDGAADKGSGGTTTAPAGAPGGAPTTKMTGAFATDLDLTVDPAEKTAPAAFEVQPGTEEATVVGAEPKARLSLVDADGHRLIVLRADKFGQVHYSYIANQLGEFPTGNGNVLPTSDGYPVRPGTGYTVRNEDTTPVQVSKPFAIRALGDHPPTSFYGKEKGKIGPKGDATTWFGYLTMRDGVQLSINVRLPGPIDKGPYPTLVEYSGYGPSNPGATEPGSLIAGYVGYATVGVNMRGTGCSGGAFDVFNPAQQADGYDVIEGIAAQPWVKGGKVGMVGLSYSGITQLYVAATRPPHLAAITSLSVIKDPWLAQWPGGVYNSGFTKQWLEERDREASATGTSWVAQRVKEGDEVCAAHQRIREQNIDFESFGKALVHRPAQDDARDLSRLVHKIEVPVYLTGAWQDEQTGPYFADFLGNFDHAPVKRFTLFNGRHPDGYTPLVLTRWYEFLELYVDHQVPRLSEGIRAAAPTLLKDNFGDVDGLEFEPDRFASYQDDQYAAVRKAYEAEPDVRILFDVGGASTKPGSPVASFERTYATWPPKDTEAQTFYLGDDGTLGPKAPTAKAADRFANDPEAGQVDFFGKRGYELLAPTWDLDWTRPPKGTAVTYVTKPFAKDTVLGGPGYAELYARVPDGDADVQVSVNLIRPDGTEWHVTSGLLRLSDRKVDTSRSKGLFVERTYSAEDSQPMPKDEFVPAKVAIPSFAQAVRTGDRIEVVISSPGRDYGAWLFNDIGTAGTPRDIGRGPGQASKLVLGVLPGNGKVPALQPPCPSLRGQACRTYEPSTNTPAP